MEAALNFLFKTNLCMQAVGQAMEIRESILCSLLYRNFFLIAPIRLWRNCKKSKEYPSKTLLGVLADYFRIAGLFCVVLIVAGCLYLIPTVWNATGHFATNIFRCGSAFSYAVFSANILFLWLILVFLVNSLSKSVKQWAKPGIAPFDVVPGFVLNSIPQPRGNHGYSGAWSRFGSCRTHQGKQRTWGSCRG